MFLTKHRKEDFIMGVGYLHNWYRNHCNGILYWVREIGLHSKYRMKWEFIANEQGRGWSVDRKSLRGNIMGEGNSG